jgi:hypothetical protein
MIRSATLRRLDDDGGSLVIALLATIMVGGLTALFLATTITGQASARFDREFTAVVHPADAGIQEALFRLNASADLGNRLPAAAPPGVACSAGSGFSGACHAGTLSASSYEWYAERIGTTREWRVYSSATRNGQRRNVSATFLEERRFFASAFANTSATFAGGNTVDSYRSGATASTWSWPNASTNSRLGIVGSNGNIRFAADIAVEGVQLWNYRPSPGDPGEPSPQPNNVFTTRCDGRNNAVIKTTSIPACSQGPAGATTNPPSDVPYTQMIPERRVVSPSAQDVAAKLAACGANPDFPTNRNTPPASLAPVPLTGPYASNVVPPRGTPGDPDFEPGYYCYRNVTFYRDTEVTGTADNPVVIYATGSVGLDGQGRRVNCVNCATRRSTEAPPVAAALQFYLGGSGTFTGGPGGQFGGTVFGPTATCGSPGNSGNHVFGSLICDTISGVGQWEFHYDTSLENIGNSIFHVTRWQED